MSERRFLDVLRTLHRKSLTSPPRLDRTGTGTWSLFGVSLTFPLSGGQFPLLTTRRLPLKSIHAELMWILGGHTDAKLLSDQGVRVWEPNTTRAFLDARGLYHLPEGDIGPSYGFNLRHFGAHYTSCRANYRGKGVDQLARLVEGLKTDPFGRRHILSLWDPRTVDTAALPPCGFNYQFFVEPDPSPYSSASQPSLARLGLVLTQRSSDIALAGGWNVASASLLTVLLAHRLGMTPSRLIWNVGDCHLYRNQVDAVAEQLERTPKPFPTLRVVGALDSPIESTPWTALQLEGYRPYPSLSIPFNA
jgi:thymidylate synthase